MIARVYPFVRLPRRFDFYDYRIPPDLAVTVGDVVRVRFRNRPMLAVVSDIVETSEFPKLFSIDEVIIHQFFTSEDVERIVRISEAVFQSPSTVFYTIAGSMKDRKGTPPFVEPPKRSVAIQSSIAEQIQSYLKSYLDQQESFLQTSIEGGFALCHALRKQHDDQMLILAPRARVAIDLAQSVSFGKQTALLTGQSLATHRERTMRGWQSGEVKTLIATRLGPLLPAHNISTIVILESSSDDYVALARNPRIDARLAAELLSHQHQARLHHTGPVADVFSVHKQRSILFDTLPKPSVVPLTSLQERSDVPLVTETLKMKMEEALQNGKDVLLSFNRKTAKEGAVLPGNDDLAELIAKQFPGHRVGIFDKRRKENGQILLVTESYFKNTLTPFARKRFGVVAELQFDLSFSGTDYRAKERAAYKLFRLLYVAQQQRAEAVIQSWSADTVQELLHHERFLQTELETRKAYRLPPVEPRVEITYPEKDPVFQPLAEIDIKELQNLPDHCIIVNDTDRYESSNRPHPSK